MRHWLKTKNKRRRQWEIDEAGQWDMGWNLRLKGANRQVQHAVRRIGY